MKKIAFLLFLTFASKNAFSQSAKQIDTINIAMKQIANIMIKKYFLIHKKTVPTTLDTKVSNFVALNTNLEDYFSDKDHVLRKSISDISYCASVEGLNKYYTSSQNTTRSYLEFVINEYVDSAFFSKYDLSEQFQKIIQKLDTSKITEVEKLTTDSFTDSIIVSTETVVDSNKIRFTAKGGDKLNKDKTTSDEKENKNEEAEKTSEGGESFSEKIIKNGHPLIYLLLGSAITLLIMGRKRKNKIHNKSQKRKQGGYDAFSDKERGKLKEGEKGKLAIENSTTNPTINNFIVIGDSVIGKSHILSKKPCQDNHFYRELDYGWFLAVTADGAGSALKSEIGSKLVAQQSVEKAFYDNLAKEEWFKKGQFPEKDELWHEIAKKSFNRIYDALKDYSANHVGISLKDLACTVIVAFVRENGILTTHIGDGRAGYRDAEGRWKSMITPFKGEEANATVFITSDIWGENKIDDFCESRVIREDITAFTLLSDGCETHAFECSLFDTETNKWSDPNIPFLKFYEPLGKSLIGMKKGGLSQEQMKQKWKEFLSKGTKGLANEPDDKTMILGILDPEEYDKPETE